VLGGVDEVDPPYVLAGLFGGERFVERPLQNP
jgi:hypothetical protein